LEIYGGGGTRECPIVIIANTSLVTPVIRFTGQAHDYKLYSTGGGLDTTTTRSIDAGVVALSIVKRIEINGVKIGGAGSSIGIYAKADVSYANPLTWSTNYQMTGNKYINNFIHDIEGEGMYIGDTDALGETVVSTWSGLDTTIIPVPVDSTTISYNTVVRCGWDGIQLAGARSGNIISYNYVKDVGLLNVASQKAGIIMGGNCMGDVTRNTVINSTGNAIEFFGYGINNCSYNTLTDAGEATIFANSYPTPYGGDALQQLLINNNQINNPPLDGAIRLYNDFIGHAVHNVYDNFFCIPGATGTWQSTYFIFYTPPSTTNTNNTLNCGESCNCIISNIKFRN